MRATTRTLVVLAIVLAFIATFSLLPSAQAASGARVTQRIDDTNLVKLARHTHPLANAKNDRGPVSDTFEADHMLLILQRSPAQEQKVNKFIDSLNDRTSPNFHKWLNAEEFGERFGVSQQDIDTVTGWLQYHGFQVNQVHANRMMIDFSGNAGQLREAFHTSIHNLDVNGELHVGNMNDPMIPAALAPVVRGITSLNDFRPHPSYKTRPDYTFAGCASATSFPTGPGTCYAVTPQDDAVIYNLTPLWNAGYSGQGQTIAVVEDTDTFDTNTPTSEWGLYRAAFGLSGYSGTYTEAHPGSCADPGHNGDDGEAAIDVEMATTFAPSAAVELISCSSTTFTFGGIIAAANLVNGAGPYPNIVSQSYGACETETGNGGTATFNAVFQTAAVEGTSVFVSTGDSGSTGCAELLTNGSEYDEAPLAVTGWGETPYNVAVGGTDFEDTYNSKKANVSEGNVTIPLSTYWNSTNTSTYGSAKQYVPEMPWDDSCANALISNLATGVFTGYGSTPGTCNNTTFDKSTNYLSTGAAAGGASNCAIGVGGTNESDYLISGGDCQGYAKPSWQSAYGVPNDGVRDIPDVSLFAANGVWGHFQTVCWDDTAETSAGATANCNGAPSTWSGFGGTSVATPSMAGIQALVNQFTGENWGNPNTIYYQIARGEYGTQGGSFLGASCNSSGVGGPASSCVFNDVTQGDNAVSCRYDGTVDEAFCYKPSTTGTSSTDSVTAATVLWGGSNYTSPTCAIAGPSNAAAYISPAGTTLYAGGTQATCTAAVSSATTTAVWTVQMTTTYAPTYGAGLAVEVGTQEYTLSGTTTTALATNLCTAVNANNTVATCSTPTSGTATLTARTTGAAGNFTVGYGPQLGGPDENELLIFYITNTTKGQGPNYVSSITITAGGSGYAAEMPITLTDSTGTGAVAVANTSPTTAPATYQPAYGAAPGYDMATGLGSVNAYNMVCNSAWGSSNTCTVSTTTLLTSSLNPSVYGQSVGFTAAVTPNTATGNVSFTIDSNTYGPFALSGGSYTYTPPAPGLAEGTHSVSATYAGAGSYSGSTSNTVSQVVNAATAGVTVVCVPDPSVYGQLTTCTATINGEYGAVKGKKEKPEVVTGTVAWSANTGCGTTPVTSGNPGTATCPTSALLGGSDTVTANYSGDANHSAGSGSASQSVSPASTTIAVTSVTPASEDYGSTTPVAISATLSWSGSGVAPTAADVTIGGLGLSGTFGATTCGAPSGDTMTCSASYTGGTDPAGTYTMTAAFSGDSNYNGSSSSQTGNFTINGATTTTSVVGSPNPSVYATSVTFTATINAENNLVKRNMKKKSKPLDVTGTVAWSSNTGCSPSAVTWSAITQTGTATCTTSSATHLPVGTDTVTATYSGDSNHSGSTGSEGQVVTGGIATTIDVTSVSPTNEDFGADSPVTITAELQWTGNGVAPTASDVTIGGNGNGTYGATSCAARVHETITCTATYTPNNSDVPGNYTETANFSGDANYAASSSPEANNFTINGATSTTSVTCSPDPAVYATSVTCTATITGENGDVRGSAKKKVAKPMDITGTVTWSSNIGCSPSTVSGYPGTATCSTSRASSLPVGSDTITATYSGDANHSGSMGSFAETITGGIATTINVTSVSPSAEDFGADSPATITAVLSWTGNGVAPTASDVTISGNGFGTYGATSCAARVHETITCTATYTPNNSDVPGSYTETAAFSGDTNYSGSTSQQTGNFTINPATTSTGVTSGTNPSTFGQSVLFTATVEGENGAVRGQAKRRAKPLQVTGGSVSWNISCDSSTPLNPSTGVATCTASTLAGGTDTVTATYTPDANHTGSSGSVSQVVNPATQTISCGSFPASQTYNTSFTASCSASSGLPVTYASAGGCSNSGTSTYTMTSGTTACLVTVTQGGNNDYSAATPFNHSVNAAKANQTINVTTAAPPTATDGSVFTIVASASSGLPITYTNGGACANSGATYTINVANGTCTVYMEQSGNSNYNAATPVIETTTVKKAVKPVVTFTGMPTTAAYGSTYTVTASSNETGNYISIPAITTTTPTVCSVGAITTNGNSASATITMLSGTLQCTLDATWTANYVYAMDHATKHTTAKKVTPTVQLTGAPATAANGSNFTVTTTSSESGPNAVVPTITTTPTSVCTAGAVTSNGSGGYQATVTMNKATGTCTTKATWPTNSDYAGVSATETTAAN